ncbi:hypothetical protein D3C75_1247170 [compost metagenome]
MADGTGNTHVGQSQDLVLLGIVVGFAVTGLAQARHPVNLILVGRTGQVLAVAQQKHRIGLEALGTVIRQLFEPASFIRQARININYRLNMLFYQ